MFCSKLKVCQCDKMLYNNAVVKCLLQLVNFAGVLLPGTDDEVLPSGNISE